MKDQVLQHIPLPIFEVSGEDGRIIRCNWIGERFLKVLGLGKGDSLAAVLTPSSVKNVLKTAEEGDIKYLEVRYKLGTGGFGMVQPRGDSLLVTLFPSLKWDRETDGILRKLWAEESRDTVLRGWKGERYLEALSRVSANLLSNCEIEEELPHVVELLRETTGTDRCCIFMNETLPDGTLVTTLKYEARKASLPPQMENTFFKRYPLEEELPRWTEMLSAGEPLMGMAEDFSGEERRFLAELGAGSVLLVPILKMGDLIGFMCLATSDTSLKWLPEEVEFLQASAGIVGSAMQRSRAERELKELTQKLEEEVRDRTRELETLYRLESLLAGALSLEEVFGEAFRVFSDVIRPHTAVAIVVGPRERGVYYAGEEGEGEEYARELLKKFIVSTADHLRTTEFTFHHLGPTNSEAARGNLFEFRVAIAPGEGNSGVISFSRRGRPFSYREEGFIRTACEGLERVIEKIFSFVKGKEKALATLLRNMNEGVVLLDPSGEVIISNPAARKYMPYLTMNGGGKRITGIGPYSLKKLIEDSRRGLVRTITFTKPRLKHLQVAAKELKAPILPGVGILLTVQDVTREEEQRRSEEAERERFASLGQLAVGIAHEFNNYLTSIGGTAELLMRACQDRDTKVKLERILKDVKDASNLTKQITSFARSSEKAGVIDILPMVKEFSKMLKRTLPDNVEIRMEYAGGAYQITAEPMRMRQILLNLTSNATEFMPGGGTLTLRVDRKTLKEPHSGFEEIPPGKYITLEVSDTGVGMDQETLKKAFSPFFTTKKDSEAKGLGLTVVYSNVKECGGYLDVKSAPGEGTTFKIYFPAHENGERGPERIDIRGDGEKILVAEDNPSLLHLESDILSSAGFHVLTATNGEEALEIIKRERPRIVVADAVMPRMGGEELYREARKFVKDLRMVLVSGYGSEDYSQSIKKGVRFLPKPFTPDELSEAVWHLSKRSK